MKKLIFLIFILFLKCDFSYDETNKIYPPDITCNEFLKCYSEAKLVIIKNFETCSKNADACIGDTISNFAEKCYGYLPVNYKKNFLEFYNECSKLVEKKLSPYEKIEKCLNFDDQELLIHICMVNEP